MSDRAPSRTPPAKVLAIGIVANDNGAVRQQAIEDRRRVVTDQFGLIADKLGAVDALTTRVGLLEKTLGEVRGLVLQLADGLSASRANWREGIDAVKAVDGSLGNMVQDLAADVAEMRGEIDIMRGEISTMGRAEDPARLLEMGDDD